MNRNREEKLNPTISYLLKKGAKLGSKRGAFILPLTGKQKDTIQKGSFTIFSSKKGA